MERAIPLAGASFLKRTERPRTEAGMMGYMARNLASETVAERPSGFEAGLTADFLVDLMAVAMSSASGPQKHSATEPEKQPVLPYQLPGSVRRRTPMKCSRRPDPSPQEEAHRCRTSAMLRREIFCSAASPRWGDATELRKVQGSRVTMLGRNEAAYQPRRGGIRCLCSVSGSSWRLTRTMEKKALEAYFRAARVESISCQIPAVYRIPCLPVPLVAQVAEMELKCRIAPRCLRVWREFRGESSRVPQG
jgi:hypothetical protein